MSFEILRTKEEQLDAIENYPKLVFFFSKMDCPHCIRADPLVKKLARENPSVKFFKIEVSESRVSNITGVPLFSIYKDGEFQGKVIGADMESLKKEIKLL